MILVPSVLKSWMFSRFNHVYLNIIGLKKSSSFCTFPQKSSYTFWSICAYSGRFCLFFLSSAFSTRHYTRTAWDKILVPPAYYRLHPWLWFDVSLFLIDEKKMIVILAIKSKGPKEKTAKIGCYIARISGRYSTHTHTHTHTHTL